MVHNQENKQISKKDKPRRVYQNRTLSIYLILLPLVIIALASVFILFYFEKDRDFDAVAIDIAGRNRMLSQRIGLYASQVVQGDRSAIVELDSAIALHDESIFVLQKGGIPPGIKTDIVIPPAESETLHRIEHAQELWSEYRDQARLVSMRGFDEEGSFSSLEIRESLNFIQENNTEMLARNDDIVKAFVLRSEQKRALQLRIFFILGFVNILGIGAVHAMLRRFLSMLQKEETYSGQIVQKLREETEKGVSGELAKQELSEREILLGEKTQDLEKQREAMLNLLEDIDAKNRELESAKAKDEAIIAAIGDGLIVVDTNGTIVLTNKSFEKILGLTNDDVVGKKLTDAIPMLDRSEKSVDASKRLMTRALETGKAVFSERENVMFYKTKQGSLVPVDITVSPIVVEGELVGAVEVFRDISQDVAIDKAKTEFVSLASHQLRTPLSAINWYTEMLLSGDAGRITKNQKIYLEEVCNGSQRMVELVNSLLNVSRLELGTFSVDPRKVNVVEMIESVLKETMPLANAKNLVITKDIQTEAPHFMADPKLLRMIVQNLISNAVKYTPEKGAVEVGLVKAEEGEAVGSKTAPQESLVFTVKDNGIGIPKDQQDKIFSKLFRADNVKQADTEGTGLGLYIIKSIVDTTGGMVWFDSKENEGTMFYVILPVSGMIKREGEKKLNPNS